jgi:hypothetical protein
MRDSLAVKHIPFSADTESMSRRSNAAISDSFKDLADIVKEPCTRKHTKQAEPRRNLCTELYVSYQRCLKT